MHYTFLYDVVWTGFKEKSSSRPERSPDVKSEERST
jgi:hypothetical protein